MLGIGRSVKVCAMLAMRVLLELYWTLLVPLDELAFIWSTNARSLPSPSAISPGSSAISAGPEIDCVILERSES